MKRRAYPQKAALHAKKRRERFAPWSQLRVTTLMKRQARAQAWQCLEIPT